MFTLLVVAIIRDPTTLTTFPPPCVFRKATGVYCPGCGSTRALRALGRGDFWAALRYNPLTIAIIFALPLLLVLRQAKFRVAYRRFAVGACIVIITFFILRNIPIPALDFLRP